MEKINIGNNVFVYPMPVTLARIFQDSAAPSGDMTVLPDVLGPRNLRRTVQVRLGFESLRLARWHNHLPALATQNHETSGLVGTQVEGRTNFMTVGWLSRVNAKPPMLAVGLNKMHYTPEGIKETQSFSVNFPSSNMVQEPDYCGLVSGRRIDKSAVFDVFYGELENAPMIEACPLCLECKLVDIYELPTNNLFIGEIVAGYTEERFLTDGNPDIEKMNPLVLTMPDNNYWTVGSHAGKAWSAGKKLKRARR